ncbi:hypothetical protein QBC35DRAFT_119946 [Podospora australis]|uniref:Uncharacterized protein n=1 Tax=Podospora australis TaxID=1536484 RepID=A0AAN6WL30_9PEZI|nr:hypothetical protein QBC35DRAFT_119946 [Podospora australis]
MAAETAEKTRGSTDDFRPTPLPMPRGSSDSSSDGGNEDASTQPVITDHSDPPHSWLSPKLALPIALIVGGAIIGGGTYGVVAYVQNLVENATVDGDEAKWLQAARTQAYDACYLGCNDCNDPEYAWKACQTTAKAVVKGINCDANKMWNWAAADRYPRPCLKAVGVILMGDALERLKADYRKRFAIITVTVLGGLAVGVLVYFLIRKFTKTKSQFTAAQQHSPISSAPPSWSITRPATWKTKPSKKEKVHKEKSSSDHYHGGGGSTIPTAYTDSYTPASMPLAGHSSRSSSRSSRSSSRPRSPSPVSPVAERASLSRRSSSSSSNASSRGGSSSPRVSTVVTGLVALSPTVSAYACTGRDAAWTQHFVSTNGTISGAVHGWFSECRDKKTCRDSCSNSCTTNSSGVRKCSKKCTQHCTTDTVTDRIPKSYVDAVMPKVQHCGFKLVDAVPHAVGTRVANAAIEKNLWVRISVSGYNVTKSGETDEGVVCLHGLGGKS